MVPVLQLPNVFDCIGCYYGQTKENKFGGECNTHGILNTVLLEKLEGNIPYGNARQYNIKTNLKYVPYEF
jgi:hypothetical protein